MVIRSWSFWRATLKALGGGPKPYVRPYVRKRLAVASIAPSAFAEFVMGREMPKYVSDALDGDKPLVMFAHRHSRQVFDDMIDKVLSRSKGMIAQQAEWLDVPADRLAPEGKRTFINCAFSRDDEPPLDASVDWGEALRSVGRP